MLLPNEQEAIHLSGKPDLGAAIAHLRRQVPLLVVKRDLAGALAWQGDGSFVQAVLPAAAGGDGIGAGDSFDAGFLAGWLAGLPASACLSIACQCGRAVAGAVGGTAAQLRLAQIEELQPA